MMKPGAPTKDLVDYYKSEFVVKKIQILMV